MTLQEYIDAMIDIAMEEGYEAHEAAEIVDQMVSGPDFDHTALEELDVDGLEGDPQMMLDWLEERYPGRVAPEDRAASAPARLRTDSAVSPQRSRPVLLRRSLDAADVLDPAIDEATRTATFVIATERAVPMLDGVEVLRVGGVDMTRFEKNPVVVDGHAIASIKSILGKARVYQDGKVLKAAIAFDDTPEGDGAWRRVKSGSLRSTSIGYRPDPEKTRHLRAGEVDGDVAGPAAVVERWGLLEVTMTPIPADEDAVLARARSLFHARAYGEMTTRATYDAESYREKLYAAASQAGYDADHIDAELDLMFESPDFLADEETLDSDSFMADEGALLDLLQAKYPEDLVDRTRAPRARADDRQEDYWTSVHEGVVAAGYTHDDWEARKAEDADEDRAADAPRTRAGDSMSAAEFIAAVDAAGAAAGLAQEDIDAWWNSNDTDVYEMSEVGVQEAINDISSFAGYGEGRSEDVTKQGGVGRTIIKTIGGEPRPARRPARRQAPARGTPTPRRQAPVPRPAPRAAFAEEARIAGIRALAMGDPDLEVVAKRLVLEGVSVEVARKRLLLAFARANPPVGVSEPAPVARRSLAGSATNKPALTEDLVLATLTGIKGN